MAAYDAIIIGAGPAGMMAAGRAAERGRRVLLLERGPALGRKLLMTGGGRCNLTNTTPREEFVRAFGRGGGFLHRALAEFGPEQLRGWLRKRGLPTIEEDDGHVFPLTGDARSVLSVLTDWLTEGRVEVLARQRVEALRTASGRVAGVRGDLAEWQAPHVVIATGGLS